MKNYYSKFNSFLSAGFTVQEYGYILLSKVKMAHLIVIIAFFISLGMGLITFYQGYYFISILDFTFAVFLMLIFLSLRKTKKYDFLALLGISLASIFYISILLTGGVSSTAALWFYTFPLFSFFLLDSKKGLIINAILLIIVIIFLVIQSNIKSMTIYSNDFIFRFIPSMLVVIIFAFMYAWTREKIDKVEIEKEDLLKRKISYLRKNRENFARISVELEKRVVERTKELDQAKKKAQNSEKIKTEFLAQMSHEIRSPLNVVLNFTQLIKMELESSLSDDMQMCFQSIDSASTRIIRTIDLILNMTDLQLGYYEKSIDKIDVNNALQQIQIEYFQSAKAKKLSLELEANFSDFIIYSDEFIFFQIICNLVDNSIKYTDEGFVKIVAKIENEENLIVEVSDSGIGMSEEFIPNIFNSFAQETEKIKKNKIGNGLGMALVKKYSELISADIKVESKKYLGSKFTVYIPNLKPNDDL